MENCHFSLRELNLFLLCVCKYNRDILMEYSKQVEKLAILLLELLSEALGLNSNYLKDTGRAKGHALLCHYSPPCPERELTLATSKQADSCFLTVLLQDHIGGPQVLHEDRWIDRHPIPGALVVNIGDLLQVSFSHYSCCTYVFLLLTRYLKPFNFPYKSKHSYFEWSNKF